MYPLSQMSMMQTLAWEIQAMSGHPTSEPLLFPFIFIFIIILPLLELNETCFQSQSLILLFAALHRIQYIPSDLSHKIKKLI